MMSLCALYARGNGIPAHWDLENVVLRFDEIPLQLDSKKQLLAEQSLCFFSSAASGLISYPPRHSQYVIEGY